MAPAGVKWIIDALKSVVKSSREAEKGLFIHESHSKAELPGELRFNIHSALGCAAFMAVIIIVNVLIFVLFRMR